MMTAPRNLNSWLPGLLGVVDLQQNGNLMPVKRDTLNFIGGTVVDNPDEARVDITLPTPTGAMPPGLFLSRPAPGTAGRVYYSTDGGYASVDDGTIWRRSVGGILCKEPPIASSWSGVNLASQTLTDSHGSLNYVGQADTSRVFRGFSLPGGTTVEAGINASAIGTTPTSSAQTGVFLLSVTGPTVAAFGYSFETTTGDFYLEFRTWVGGYIEGDCTIADNYPLGTLNGPHFIRMVRSGNDVTIYESRDLATWRAIHTYSGFFSGATPTLGGIGGYGMSGISNLGSMFHWDKS